MNKPRRVDDGVPYENSSRALAGLSYSSLHLGSASAFHPARSAFRSAISRQAVLRPSSLSRLVADSKAVIVQSNRRCAKDRFRD